MARGAAASIPAPAPDYRRCFFQSLGEAGWAPGAIILLNLLLTFGLDAYDRFPVIDIPMHLFGGMACAYAFHRGSLNASHYGVIGPYHPLTHHLLVLGGTCGVALLWEVGEYLSDVLFGTSSLGSSPDTLGDMLLGLLGAEAVLGAVSLRRGRHAGVWERS